MAVRVLFVCLGNICRSPTAEGVFRHLVAQEGLSGKIEIESAGTAAYHVGQPPDHRSQAAALRRGIDMSHQRAQQAKQSDFGKFDYVLAMDEDNLQNLQAICPDPKTHNPGLFLSFSPQAGRTDVPDPYYGGSNGFEMVLDLIEGAAQGLLADIREQYHL